MIIKSFLHITTDPAVGVRATVATAFSPAGRCPHGTVDCCPTRTLKQQRLFLWARIDCWWWQATPAAMTKKNGPDWCLGGARPMPTTTWRTRTLPMMMMTAVGPRACWQSWAPPCCPDTRYRRTASSPPGWRTSSSWWRRRRGRSTGCGGRWPPCPASFWWGQCEGGAAAARWQRAGGPRRQRRRRWWAAGRLIPPSWPGRWECPPGSRIRLEKQRRYLGQNNDDNNTSNI